MSRPWKIIPVVLLAIVGTLGYFIAQLVLPGPKIVVSKETTYVTSPIAADGLPDYAQYLRNKLKEGVTPENNAAIPLLQAMWPPFDVDSEDYSVLCEELGMEIPERRKPNQFPWQDSQFLEKVSEWLRALAPAGQEISEEDPRFLGENYVGWAEDEPWMVDEIPLLAEWIEREQPLYDMLHEAAGREKCYCPSFYLPGRTHLDLKCLTHSPLGYDTIAALQLLSLRSNLRLESGDVVGAWEDCWGMHRLSQHVPQDFTNNEMTAMVAERNGNSMVRRILSSSDLDTATARKMLEFFKDRGLREGVATRIDEGQRLVMLCYAISISGQGGADRRIKDEREGELHSPWHRTLDWNEILRVINAEYDLAVAEFRNRHGRANVTELFDPAGLEGHSPGVRLHPSRKERTNYFVAKHMLTGLEIMGPILEMEDRANSHRQLLTTAAALAVHRLEQGEYPESLDPLVPDLLDTLPTDIYDGKPLAYRRTKEGYLLYSRGPNGVDDGGSNRLLEMTEGYDPELWDFAATRENLNAVRELLGWPLLTEEEFAEREEADAEPEEVPVIVAGRSGAGDDSDDLSIRMPLPRLKLPLPGFPPPRE